MKRTIPGTFVVGKGQPAFKKTTAKKKADYNIGRQHPKQPGAELKAFDTNMAAIPFNGQYTILNVPKFGTDMFNRIGRKMYMKSILIDGQIISTVALATNELVRLIVIYDSQANAAFPSNVLQDANPAAASNVYSQINLDYRERLTILRDIHLLTPTNAVAGELQTNTLADIKTSLRVHEYVPLRGRETIFNVTNGGTIADITSGALWIYTSGSSGDWAFTGTIRLRYYD